MRELIPVLHDFNRDLQQPDAVFGGAIIKTKRRGCGRKDICLKVMVFSKPI